MDFFVYVAETIGVPVDQVFIYVTPIQNCTHVGKSTFNFQSGSTILRIKKKLLPYLFDGLKD